MKLDDRNTVVHADRLPQFANPFWRQPRSSGLEILDRPDGSGTGSTIAIYNICPDAPIQTVTHCIASAEALLYAMLPDAGKIEFSHARSSLGVDLDAANSSLPGIAALDDLFQNIENLICLCIDPWIASAVFLRDNDRSAAAGPSAFIVSRLILPEASFYLENGQSNERKADAKPSEAMRCDAMIQSRSARHMAARLAKSLFMA